MKRIASLLLALLFLFVCALPAMGATAQDSFGAYKHVFIIGIDGAGGFFDRADTPEFDRIFANGAVTLTARAEYSTVSAQNWGAILCGVSAYTHGIRNSSAAEVERSGNVENPTVFSLARKAFPDAELASFVNWEPINFGIIETDVGVLKERRDSDEAVTDAICDYFNNGGAPTLFFVQLDSVDGAGHSYGCYSPEYREQIHVVDGLLGRIYDAIAANGLMEDGLFIVTTDHGHTPEGGHGGPSKTESEVTVAAVGKTVASGGVLDAETRNRDVAAITLYALGIDRPAHMTARIPANLFTGVAGEERPLGKDLREVINERFPWIAPVTWNGFSLPLYTAAMICGAVVLLYAAVTAVLAAVKKRGLLGLTVFVCTALCAVLGTWASKLFVLWDNLPLYAFADALFLLCVAGVVMCAAYAHNGFAFPKGKRLAGKVILSLAVAAAPYEIAVLVVNTLIYHGTKPTRSIVIAVFFQAAVLLASITVVIVKLCRENKDNQEA